MLLTLSRSRKMPRLACSPGQELSGLTSVSKRWAVCSPISSPSGCWSKKNGMFPRTRPFHRRSRECDRCAGARSQAGLRRPELRSDPRRNRRWAALALWDDGPAVGTLGCLVRDNETGAAMMGPSGRAGGSEQRPAERVRVRHRVTRNDHEGLLRQTQLYLRAGLRLCTGAAAQDRAAAPVPARTRLAGQNNGGVSCPR